MKKISALLLLFTVILITGISGCGSDINSNTDKKIKVTIPFDLSEKLLQKSNEINNSNNFYGPAPTNVRSVRVDAVYPDGRKFSGFADVAAGTNVEVVMEVDEGSNIYFAAQAYDAPAATGNLLYMGTSSSQTLVMGMSYDISIQMTANTGAVTPTVSSVSPAPGSTGVPPSGIITIIFSKLMDPSSINATTITGVTAPIINTSGSTVTISPTPWYSNTTYTITITTGVKDILGNAMATPYTWSFTTGTDGGGGGGGGGTSLPTAFSLSSPSNGSTGVSLTQALAWTDSTGETGYAIEIATDPAFTAIIDSGSVGTNTIGYPIPSGKLSSLTTYYWRVKAINSYGNTLASNAPFTFTTTSGGGGGGGSAPTAFTLGAPLNSSTGVSLTPTLSWTDSSSETSYTIEIATDAAFTTIAHTTSVGTDTINHTVPAGKLSSSTYYWWRVKAVNSYGNTLASNSPFTFTTTSGGGGSAPTAFNFSLPLNGATGVSTTPPLSWTDSVGETSYAIEISANSSFTPMTYSTTVGTDVINHTVPAGNLSSGTTYYWRVKAINSYGATTVSNAPFTFTTQ